MIFRFKLKYMCAVIIFFVITVSILFLNSLSLRTCAFDNEPIDVVYTWVNGSDPLFLEQLDSYTKHKSKHKMDKSKMRYFDRHELKFSLRSLEKYAPWIRNVYIVTNGQIPYWLNLDYEQVFLISHEDIFPDSYDLPSFSSPSIESHLHRIPGISKKFLYFNDDIYLGAPVYLDDFYTHGRGYRIYLDYPMPNCAADCPWLYVHDGQCDKECNVVDCQMDGGDCQVDATFALPTIRNEPSFNVTYLNSTQIQQIENKNNSSQNISQIAKNETNFEDVVAKLPPDLEQPSLKRLVHAYNNKRILKDKIRGKGVTATRKPRTSHKDYSFDAYKESLQHTNRLYNAKYGFAIRHVPAHMPFLIDTDIMTNLIDTFPKEFEETSRNRIRSRNDVQFAFSYFHFIMEEKIDISIQDIFDIFDTDLSGTWSDREIRTLLTRLHGIPLNTNNIDDLDKLLVNCSKNVQTIDITTPEYERYIDSILPTISKDLILQCEELKLILSDYFGKKPKYLYEVSKEIKDYVTFDMIVSNIQSAVVAFDKIRKKSTKFVCLNDNVYSNANESTINAIWYDFYVSLFPIQSKFELPSEYRNRFLYIQDLKWYQTKITLYLYGCVTVFILCFLCKNKFTYFFNNKLFC